MSLKALIFDCDGVLVDTERDGHRVAFNQAFQEFGLSLHWDIALYGRLLKQVAGGRERLHQYFDEVGWPDCGELDIVEMGKSDAITRGLTNRWVGSTAHWELNGTHVYYGRSLVSDVDLNDDYHVFKMDWTPTLVTTYLDGQEMIG